MTPAGDFIIAWYSSSAPVDVFAQRFDRTGARVGSDFRVNTYTTAAQWGARVAALRNGDGFVVTWDSNGQDGHVWGVFGQVLDADGQRRGAEFRVNEHSLSNQYARGVAGGPAARSS